MASTAGGCGCATSPTSSRRNGVDDPDVINVFAFLLGAVDVEGSALKDAAPDVVQQRIDWAVRRGLDLICARGPVLLAVEDVHWIDPTSRRLLLNVAERIDRYPLLLVMTTRPKPAADWAGIARLTHVRLHSLDLDETRRAIAGMRPSAWVPVAPDLLNWIYRITGGVPLLIEEICQWMIENPGRGGAPARHRHVPDHVPSSKASSTSGWKRWAGARSGAGGRRRRQSVQQALLRPMLPELD